MSEVANIDLGDFDAKIQVKQVGVEEAWQLYLSALDRELKEAKQEASTELLQTWACYTNHRNKLKAADKAVGAKMEQVEESVVNTFLDLGLEKWTSKGRTISLRRELWAGHQEDQKEALCEALIAANLSEYVNETYNTQSLSSYVREFDPDGELTPEEIIEKLPEEVRPFIKVTRKIKVGNHKA